MALSLSNYLYSLVLFVSLCLVPTEAATRYFNWDIDWVLRNPDGLFERPVIGINGQWPLPLLNITKGDRLIIEVNNKLGNQSTSVHFHGLFQNGTNDMDGPVGVTQCPIPPGQTMTYNFTINQPGTYWYHSHSYGQYPDGFRGIYVVHDPENPYYGQFDEELALSVSDWYHDQLSGSNGLIEQFINYQNPTGAEPIPKSALMNDTQNLTISVQPDRTYFIRLVSMSAFSSMYFWIEDHEFTIIEVDGVYTKPQVASMVYIADSQRYGFLLKTKSDASRNYAIIGSMDTTLFDIVPPTLNWNVTSYLVYNESAPKIYPADIETFNPYDDFYLVSYDGLETFTDVGKTITLNMMFTDLDNGASYAFFNDVSYVTPDVPTLYSALSVGEAATNETVYGTHTNSYVLNKGDVIEIVVNNNDTGKHPFHLHGHNFQAYYRSPEDNGEYIPDPSYVPPKVPMRRDTFIVYPMGSFVVRFVADNPGIWFFHCHIDWHLITGLAAVMVEAPMALQETLKVPENHYDMCRIGGMEYKGNAAGNTADVYDLTGEPTGPKPLPSGFTAGGIVALTFSCVAAILGMAVIVWYGAAPLSAEELNSTKNFIKRATEGSSSTPAAPA